MARARVLLADDHPALAVLLRAMLEPEFEVIATVGDGRELLAAARALSPDVIVADISMPILDGIEAAHEILKADPEARIVFVTAHNDPTVVRRALSAGGLGYILKDTAAEDLVPAIHAALRGERRISLPLRAHLN